MIKIREDLSKSVAGYSSLYLSFDFNKDIIDTIKYYSKGYSFSKKTKEWEVSINGCSELLDFLSVLDDIEINTLPYNKNQNLSQFTPLYDTFKTKPFPYQLEGITYGINHPRFLLLDDMGLGKTLQSIYIAQELKRIHNIEHCFIICGINAAKTNWKREIEKHSNLDAMILGERINKKGKVVFDDVSTRAEQLKNKINEFFIITNIETIRDERVVSAFNDSENKIDLIIFDECHTCKDTGTIQYKNLMKLDSKYKIAMSGTLVVNDPLDCYAPLHWIGMENGTQSAFKGYYCVYNDDKMIVGFKNLDELQEQVSECSLRRLKSQVLTDLPPKTIINEIVEMSNEQTKLYTSVEEGIAEEVDLVNLHPGNLLSKVTRLRQATSCPQTLSSKDIISAKVSRCLELVDELVSRGNKAVIFTSFKEVANQVSQLLNVGSVTITGDTKDSQVYEYIDKFQQDDSCKVLVATWQKMGTAYTLTSASYAIFIDTPWTSAKFKQACDRIYRIGSKQPVFIYKLICNNTIDVGVDEKIEYKEALSDYIIDDNLDNNSMELLTKYVLGLKGK